MKKISVRYKQANSTRTHTRNHAHTHVSRLTALCPGLPGWAGTRKVKPIWILLKQETVSGSGISWAVCKSASRSRQITTPAPHHSVFYRPDALPAAQPTASKHWRHQANSIRSAEIKHQLKGALCPAARMRYDPQRVCLARLEEKQKFTKRIRRLFQREHRWRVRPETWDPDTSRSHRSKWTWWRLCQLACAAAKTDLHHTTKQHPQTYWSRKIQAGRRAGEKNSGSFPEL